MIAFARICVVLFIAAALAACGSTSRLKSSAAEKREIKDYDRVVVVDFDSKLTKKKKFKSDEARVKFEGKVEKAGIKFADNIAKQLTETGAFAEVVRASAGAPVDPDALRVGGTITRYSAGNIAARAVTGFVGQTHFEADVITSAPDGRELGRIEVDHNSWPLPVGSTGSVVQTPGFFMSLASMKVADELAIAKGKRARGASRPANETPKPTQDQISRDDLEAPKDPISKDGHE